MPTWDADLYLKFAAERTQPSFDSVSRVNLPDFARLMDEAVSAYCAVQPPSTSTTVPVTSPPAGEAR